MPILACFHYCCISLIRFNSYHGMWLISTEKSLSSVCLLVFSAHTHNNLVQKMTYTVSKFYFSPIQDSYVLCLCETFHVGPIHSLLSIITLIHLHLLFSPQNNHVHFHNSQTNADMFTFTSLH